MAGKRVESGCKGVRHPRVCLEYEMHGPDGAMTVELPFVMGVMADLSGEADLAEKVPTEHRTARGELEDREFLLIDAVTFDDQLKAMKPQLSFSIPQTLTDEGGEIEVELTFDCLDDFAPGRVASKVAGLSQLLEIRTRICELLSSLGNSQSKDQLYQLLHDCAMPAPDHSGGFRTDARGTAQQLITRLDELLEQHLNRILHHEKFQQLEGSWRGLHYLVRNTPIDQTLKIKVLNISKSELARTLTHYKGAQWEESPIYRKICAEPLEGPEGEPYGCLVGDYYFDQGARDVEVLGEIGKIAAAAHAPCITGASPPSTIMDSWQELSFRDRLARCLELPEYAKWRSLRQSDDSRFVVLAMPRLLGRLPYSPQGNPVEEFLFREDCEGSSHRGYTWFNAAYAVGVNINRAFKEWSWCARICGFDGGGRIENPCLYSFPTPDGGQDMMCPTEISITDRHVKVLADLGFMPVISLRNSDVAAFVSAQSLHKPRDYGTRSEAAMEATAGEILSSRLPYLLPACRFAHYLKVIARDRIGGYTSCEELQNDLRSWISGYVTAEIPLLKAAEVVVQEHVDRPNCYFARLSLQPSCQVDIPFGFCFVFSLPGHPGRDSAEHGRATQGP